MHTNPEVLALLALGEDSATPDEWDHVASCEICTHEVAELAHLASIGRLVEGAETLESPRPEVWERIRAEIASSPTAPAAGVGATSSSETEPSRTTPAETSHPQRREGDQPDSRPLPYNGSSPPSSGSAARPAADRAPEPRRGRGTRILAFALAAVVALIAGVGIGLGINRLLQPPQPTVVAEAQLDSVADAWTGSSGEATLERDASGQRILVVRVTTPRPVPGIRVVWVMDSTFKDMQTVGQLTGSEGRFTLEPTTNLTKFSVVDVSEEPPNDTTPIHSGITIVRGKLNL